MPFKKSAGFIQIFSILIKGLEYFIKHPDFSKEDTKERLDDFVHLCRAIMQGQPEQAIELVNSHLAELKKSKKFTAKANRIFPSEQKYLNTITSLQAVLEKATNEDVYDAFNAFAVLLKKGANDSHFKPRIGENYNSKIFNKRSAVCSKLLSSINLPINNTTNSEHENFIKNFFGLYCFYMYFDGKKNSNMDKVKNFNGLLHKLFEIMKKNNIEPNEFSIEITNHCQHIDADKKYQGSLYRRLLMELRLNFSGQPFEDAYATFLFFLSEMRNTHGNKENRKNSLRFTPPFTEQDNHSADKFTISLDGVFDASSNAADILGTGLDILGFIKETISVASKIAQFIK